jgi:hypothetical protein
MIAASSNGEAEISGNLAADITVCFNDILMPAHMFCMAGILKLNPDELYNVYYISPEQKAEAARQAVSI